MIVEYKNPALMRFGTLTMQMLPKPIIDLTGQRCAVDEAMREARGATKQ